MAFLSRTNNVSGYPKRRCSYVKGGNDEIDSTRNDLYSFCLDDGHRCPLWAQDYAGRKELKRADLSGAPGMEVVLSVVEMKPGAQLPLHIHHGIETAYVLEGGMVEAPRKPPFAMPTGAPIMALRDVEHGGFTVVGDKTIKLFTVHIVDKGKPLYDWVKK